MDIKKATEIIESKGVIDVDYNGNSVWIENIIETSEEADVKDLKTGERHRVNVSMLEER